MRILPRSVLIAFVVLLVFASGAHAAEGEAVEPNVAVTFFYIVIVLLTAKISSFVERIGQPAVLGELVAGVILGNLVLIGISFFEPIKTDPYIRFLAELGVVILLFQVGLESNIDDMRRVGMRALLVACVGVVLPFVLGTMVVGPLVLPGLDQRAYLFLGATLTATSVGITARVFRDLGKLQTPEAQIVLGAAVIDDVLGLIILAVVSAIVTSGTVSPETIAFITFKAIAFLGAAIVLGQLLAPRLSKLFSAIHTGTGMKFTVALSFGLALAYLAHEIGLAPIVGAFAAGLVLDPVHFDDFREPEIVDEIHAELNKVPHIYRERFDALLKKYSDRHIQDLLEPLGYLLVPIFFLLTGMNVRLDTLFNLNVLMIALGITVAAFVGKIAAGLVAGPVSKILVGVGMIPRGEVGLIFAASGKALGVVNDEVFSIIVIVVILSTLVTPPMLAWLLRRSPAPAAQTELA